ncbi:response regulator [Rhizorhabdus dicambivorans]|nr:response regulator [Rhizorhabdus dicambivorans]
MRGLQSEIHGDRRPLVLIVEDEHFVRMMAVDALQDAGYATIEAEDGDRALTLLDERDDIELVFTDIRMPGQIDGLDLARRIQSFRPRTPVVLTSGHMFEGDRDIPASTPFLQKPYRAAALIGQLDRIFGRA